MASALLNDTSDSSDLSSKRTRQPFPLNSLAAAGPQLFELPQLPNDGSISKIAAARHLRVASINSVELDDYFKRPASQAASTRAILIKPSTGSYEDWAQVIETSFNFTSNLKDTSSFVKQLDGTRFGSPVKFDAKQMFIEKKIMDRLAPEVSNVIGSKKEDSHQSSREAKLDKSCEKLLGNQTGDSESAEKFVIVESLIPDLAPPRQGSKSPEFGATCTPTKPRTAHLVSSRKLQSFTTRPREYTLKDRLQDCILQKSMKTLAASSSKPASFKNTPTKPKTSRALLSHRSSSRLDVKLLLMEKHKQEIFDSLSKKHRMAFDSAKREEDCPKTEFERLLDRKRETSRKKTASASSTQLHQLEGADLKIEVDSRRKDACVSKMTRFKEQSHALVRPRTLTSPSHCGLQNRLEPASLSSRRPTGQQLLSRTPRASGKPIVAFGVASHLCDLTPFKVPVHLSQMRKHP